MMYDRQFYSRMVRFQRTAMDNTFAIITSLQGYGDKFLKKTLEQTPWLPEKSRSTCAELSNSCLSGSQTLKKFIDQGFDEMERLVTRTAIIQKSEGEAKTPPPPATASTRKQPARQKPAPSRKPTVSSAAKPAVKPVTAPVMTPFATSPAPPTPTAAATMTKPSGPAEKTAPSEITAAGKTP